jgi:HSP20 family protein
MQRKRKDTETPYEMKPAVERRWLIMIQQNTRPFSPPTDVIELADRLVVLVEIAGMRTSDLSIKLMDRQLVISGTREQPQFPNPAYHQVEIGFGDFRIEITLPWSADRDGVSASYEAGFLQVELPRKVARQIPIVDVSNVE